MTERRRRKWKIFGAVMLILAAIWVLVFQIPHTHTVDTVLNGHTAQGAPLTVTLTGKHIDYFIYTDSFVGTAAFTSPDYDLEAFAVPEQSYYLKRKTLTADAVTLTFTDGFDACDVAFTIDGETVTGRVTFLNK